MRLATPEDAPAIAALIRESILALFPRYYDAEQTASGAVHIGALDLALIEDGTYYVHEEGGEIVACGGWSRRDKLFTGAGEAAGDARLLDPATEPARVRAMFVRERLDPARPRPRDPRRLRACRARRGLHARSR